MNKNNILNNERALLIGVQRDDQDSNILKEHLAELKLLAETAGAEVVGEIYQSIKKINSQFFVGKGKASQIIEQAKELKVKLVIFDDELTPSQVKKIIPIVLVIKPIAENPTPCKLLCFDVI